MHYRTFKKRILSYLLAIVIVGSAFTAFAFQAAAAPALPAVNTETRHQTVCTSLSSDALAYYTGNNTYAALSALQGASNTSTSDAAMQNNPLYTALQNLMTSTQTYNTTYSGTSEGSLAYYWQRTDAQNGNAGSFVLVYCDNVVSVSSSSFNREHVWPKSNASFYQSNGGSDLHHLRPADPTINSTRGNLPFGNVQGLSGATRGSCYWKTSSYFEPEDNVKGDVARILLYVYVRWGENNIYSDTSNGSKIIESLDTLLNWIKLDPVDTWEMKRNDLTQDVQGNRNVFIDYPELAYLMFGRSVPSDIVTPSTGSCSHNWTLTASTAATCTTDGSRTYVCTLCQSTKTETDAAIGHNFVLKSSSQPTCTAAGVTVYRCSNCGEENTVTANALGHSYDEGVITTEPTATEPGVKTYTCARCGGTRTETIAPLGVTDTNDVFVSRTVIVGDKTKNGETKRAATVVCGVNADVINDIGSFSVDFTFRSGEQTKTFSQTGIKKIYTTLSGYATTDSETASSQGIRLISIDGIDQLYIFGFTFCGIDPNEYSLDVSLSAKDENGGTLDEYSTFEANIPFTV